MVHAFKWIWFPAGTDLHRAERRGSVITESRLAVHEAALGTMQLVHRWMKYILLLWKSHLYIDKTLILLIFLRHIF